MKVYNNYFSLYSKYLENLKDDRNLLFAEKLMRNTFRKNKTTFIFGNGGSTSIASHLATDISNKLGAKCITSPENSLMTCISNDYGYENIFLKQLEIHSKVNDLAIIISSSGNSENILKAAKFCIRNKLNIITLTGMNKNNKLNRLNKIGPKFWIDSSKYNIIENMHQLILLSIFDMIIEK